jgi:mRNA-degrading endonuclease toxin of MazEF toxin-antitoxin module
MVISAPVSTAIRGYAVEVKVGRRVALPKTTVINCDWLLTLPKRALSMRIGMLSERKLEQLDEALKFALGLR